MDVISYGVANQAGKEEKKTRTTLGSGVEGSSPHVKERIDKIEKSIAKVTEKANKLIVNDTINIMKANAKLNTIAKTSKYKMHNMIFDDLLDLSGIDTLKSSGYTHDAVNGWINPGANCLIESITEVTDSFPTRAILTVEEAIVSEGNLIPTLTSNTSAMTSVGKAFSSNTNTGYAVDAWYAFDGKSGTEWGGNYINGPTPAYIGFQFNSPKVVTKYLFSAPNSAYYPVTWKFKGSNDGINYRDLHVVSVFQTVNPNVREYEFNNKDAFTHYCFEITRSSARADMPAIHMLNMKEANIQENKTLQGIYSISRDSGVTWERITPNTLFYFKENISPLDKKIKLKAELPNGTKLLNYALTWA